MNSLEASQEFLILNKFPVPSFEILSTLSEGKYFAHNTVIKSVLSHMCDARKWDHRHSYSFAKNIDRAWGVFLGVFVSRCKKHS